MSSDHTWNPELYDNKLGFVAQYGKGVVDLLQPRSGETILDLGCGTGDLSIEIAKSGAKVIGMDYSAEMIDQARNKYADIEFIVGNAEHFAHEITYDAVFSNAALHWIKNAASVVSAVHQSLKPGGRFIAEFGGKGNVESIVAAIRKVLAEDYGIDANKRSPWYFPSIGEYSSMLEHAGFRVTYAVHFDRPTKLADGETGLSYWLNGFAGNDFFYDFNDADKKQVFDKIRVLLKNDLYKDGAWYADYKRIRFIAVKS
ncbi:trans-aconitate 2-methyltransferase [Paenibacillus sp. XY044]|uniref:class I SAM-dependent methyltransferase n=1 Tax=Paenibacillus sp. XY044 TaxID=2026089 RepID=UPI000B9875FB|nr:class I SAM-dependent methyltransferase [Paenibacillus sp. XY044]OZB95437.1 SAM-dependent methyltransferase [Paenibacillus sp. XY044]